MKYILIDLSYLAHRARYSMSDLNHEDIPTGVLFGFFEQLYTICNTDHIQSNKVFIFADSKHSYRKKAYPGYKEKRQDNRTEEEKQQIKIMYKQVDKLSKSILPKLGFPVYGQFGLESDDLIDYVSAKLTQKKKHGIIITADGDLYQSITDYVKWYDPGRNLFMNKKKFKNKYGIDASQWGTVKSMAGCASDSVPGLEGIGEKTAIKFLNRELPSHYKKFKTIMNSNVQIEKWAELTILPHRKIKSFEIKEPEYNIKKFFDMSKHFGILSYLEPKRKKQWVNFFKGDFKNKIRRKIRGKRKLI